MFPNFLDVAPEGFIPKSMWVPLRWMIRHRMYAYDAPDPFVYIQKLNDYKMADIGPRLTQDVLILAASRDHFIPASLYQEEIDALSNVRSLTFRLMTEKEDGQDHCNVGNPKLVPDTVLLWLDGLKKREMEGNI